MSKVIRVLVLALGVVMPACSWYARLENVRDQYESLDAVDDAPTPPEQEGLKTAVEAMSRQNDLLINWAVIILGGLVALAVTSKVHAGPPIPWVYILLGPAASYLAGSLWGGVLFQRRLSFLLLRPLRSVASLNALLGAQSELFQFALLPLGVFFLVFLALIVYGRVNPVDSK